MKKTAVVRRLKALGDDLHRSTCQCHGVTGPLFGVPYAELYRLQKEIGRDEVLAEALWATGNHDACILATFIADPREIKPATLDQWAKVVRNQLLLDAVAGLASRTPRPRPRMSRWMKSTDEWTAACGWQLLAALASQSRESPLGDDELAAYLDEICRTIHQQPHRVRHSMNQALISIGLRGEPLQRQALAAARKIGKVEVDHGRTGCQTPAAAPAILRALQRRRRDRQQRHDAASIRVARRPG